MINGQNHVFARAIEIMFFRDLILADASEMNNTVGFIFKLASKLFLFKLVWFQHSNSIQSVSSTFLQEFGSMDSINFGNLDICFVLN